MVTKSRPRSARSKSYYVNYEENDHDLTVPVRNTNLTWTDSHTGVDNPYWRAQIRNGGNATTAAQGQRIEISGIDGGMLLFEGKQRSSLSQPWHARRSEGYGDFFDTTIPPDPSGIGTSTADSTARSDFLANCREARTEFQGGTFFGELGEAIRMVKRPAKAIRDLIDSYVRLAKKRANRYRGDKDRADKAVARTWLEYSYGWRPLTHDVQDALDALTTLKYRDFIVVKGKGQTSATAFGSEFGHAYDLVTVNFRNRLDSIAQVRYKGAMQATAYDSTTRKLETWGFSPDNFIPTVYNLIPFSFLVDYFSNVGDVIDGMSLRRVNLRWGCKTVRQVNQTTPDAVRTIYPTYNDQFHKDFSLRIFSRGNGIRRRTRFTRSSVAGVDVSLMDITFRIPGVQDPRKWINLAALGRSRTAW